MNTARFRLGDDYRQFLNSIEPHLACDVIQWAFIEDRGMKSKRDDLFISVDLDAGSYCNDGQSNANMGNTRMKTQGEEYHVTMSALRDIKEGEEFLCDYSDFAVDGISHGNGTWAWESSWEIFGL